MFIHVKTKRELHQAQELLQSVLDVPFTTFTTDYGYDLRFDMGYDRFAQTLIEKNAKKTKLVKRLLEE
jgi:hypothetical protein